MRVCGGGMAKKVKDGVVIAVIKLMRMSISVDGDDDNNNNVMNEEEYDFLWRTLLTALSQMNDPAHYQRFILEYKKQN